MTRMFHEIGLPSETAVPLALKALERDSQNGMVGQRGHAGISVPDKVWQEMDAILEEVGSPVRTRMPLQDFRAVIKGHGEEVVSSS